MVLSPPTVEPTNSIPSSATNGRTNEVANFLPPYHTVAYSTPSMETGAPKGPMPDSYFNKYSAPSRVPPIKPKPPPSPSSPRRGRSASPIHISKNIVHQVGFHPSNLNLPLLLPHHAMAARPCSTTILQPRATLAD
jgi:hypothetical protein